MPIVGYTDQATISRQTLPVPVLAMVKKGAEKPERGVGRNLDHFRFVWMDKRAEELFNRLYGADKQHELLITVLSDTPDAVMDSAYRLYSSNNVMQRKCDGCTILSSFQEHEGSPCVCTPALRDSDDPEERRGQCSPKAYFRFTIPDLCKSLGYLGQFILLTGSVNEMRDIATVLHTVKASTGKLLGQPFLLRRSEREYDIVLKGKPSKSKQFNVELVPPLQLVLSNLNTPILGAPEMAALPSGEDLENQPSDWVCNSCGNRASEAAAYSLLMECPDCGGAFVHEDDGKKFEDSVPPTARFSPPAQRDINNVDEWVDSPARFQQADITAEALTKFGEACEKFLGMSINTFLGGHSVEDFAKQYPDLNAMKQAAIEAAVTSRPKLPFRIYGVKTEATNSDEGVRYLIPFGFGSVFAYSRDAFEANTDFDAHGTYFNHETETPACDIQQIGNHSFKNMFKRDYLLMTLRYTEAKNGNAGGKLVISEILDPRELDVPNVADSEGFPE